MGLPNYGQDNTVIPQRTPEQEATKQTEKLQQELDLNQEQAKQVYEINLKYARERQVSNTRSAAMERMKNKNATIERVLNEDQNYRLQTKRYERTTIEIPSGNRSTPSNSPGYNRSSSDYRSNPSVRVPSNDNNLRSNYRSTAPQSQGTTPQNQTLRRSTTTPSYTPRVLQPSTRSSSGNGNSYSAPRQTVTPSSSQNNSSSRSQSAPSGTPRRAETPGTTNRR